MQRVGVISDLELQPEFELQEKFVNGKGRTIRPIKYVGDFKYKDQDGNTVVEDTKGYQTEAYKLKRKLFDKQYYPLTITEV